ncbi:MarR family winged helix-turn-helix transcriptional regulator [Thermogemmatispora sp.]|uniref:MarR family winged helix-turn-helix transcriptional regulator n=1 Tax=Thermogemmatispora sp. TaxID=1968838 RepID=UPI0035E45C0B
MSSERARLEQAVKEHFGRELSAYTLMFHQAVASRLGLNMTDLKCLDLAREGRQLTPGRLAELTGLTTAAVTAILDRLEEAGFVRRERDPNDRRKILVRPLPDRIEEVTHLFAPLDKAVTHLLGQYTTEELAFLDTFAQRMSQILRQETARLREPSSTQVERTRD